jgi:PadR family transcriptional regulator, regulatory protein PadR
MRLTKTTVDVLETLSTEPARAWWGFDLARACGLPTATVYGVLARLEDAEIVSGEFETEAPETLKRPRRRLYRFTPAGAEKASQFTWDWQQRHRRPQALRERTA